MSEELPQEVLDFIQTQWGCGDPLCMPSLTLSQWQSLGEQAYQDKIKAVTGRRDAPFCLRLVGQSGSGKTSQLLPALQHVLSRQQQGYVSFAVRDFTRYHPHAFEIEARYGQAQFREKTNAFALTLLSFTFLRCAQARLPMLFEVTLLSSIYERWMHAILRSYGYSCDYHCLAVQRSLSDAWIEMRGKILQREVSQRSSDFFFTILPIVFKSLQTVELENRVFLWDCFHKTPQMTHLADIGLWNRMVELSQTQQASLDFQVALQAKIDFLYDFYTKNRFFIA